MSSKHKKKTMLLYVKEHKCDLGGYARQLQKFGEEHGLSKKLVFQMTLVIDEVVSNTAAYGYTDCDKHCISVDIHREGNVLVIVIMDTAQPFDLTTAPLPELETPVEDRTKPVGGMGIHLVRSLVDSIEYRHENGKNVLEIRKTIDTDGNDVRQ
ncbi:MAG: ATP-binding protein [Oceanidesulfovibrio sp.]